MSKNESPLVTDTNAAPPPEALTDPVGKALKFEDLSTVGVGDVFNTFRVGFDKKLAVGDTVKLKSAVEGEPDLGEAKVTQIVEGPYDNLKQLAGDNHLFFKSPSEVGVTDQDRMTPELNRLYPGVDLYAETTKVTVIYLERTK
ncbi:hypothetical protein CPT_Seuss63 [Caulobacter phage Seuss]|uniref:Uncharacterized protein n=1 Tax=Caulobacter phage Seuss TaxID=1675601 RepID=A0A0K1LM97_9CAUD|nr:hypothetical protein HOR08_gp063 [Caulobacter phage Seuss]AKU43589.1 hypothetical protein CPT_Seuss63 [Caulobacter phage Seuss]